MFGRGRSLRETSAPSSSGQEFTLSDRAPSAAQKRLALSVVVVLVVGFVIAAGPLSSLPLTRVDAFIPAYGTAILVNNSITAVLLYAQFSIQRSRALLALASGYLLTGFIAIPWMLTFPGVFAPTGLLGAGLQSTGWLYVAWHMVFALSVIAYTLMKDADPARQPLLGSTRAAILASVGSVVVLLCGVTALVTAGEPLLPRLFLDGVRLSGGWFTTAGSVAALIVGALGLLWLRRRSVLDLWLMVVLCAYVIEIALISFPIPIRFSLGWYAGRMYGLLSGSLVLLMLLEEITTLYGELLRAVLAQRREREARLMTGDAVTASVAHEIRQPLSAMTINAEAGLRWLDRPTPDLNQTSAALQRIVADGRRAAVVIENIRELFRRSARGGALLDVNAVISEALYLMRDQLQAHDITVQTDCDGALPPIEGDQVQLQQVLVNLITNAIKSMASDKNRLLRVTSRRNDASSVLVSVQDFGKGVEPNAVERIFHPLFTTKPHGMGMGLSICRSIIEVHGGALWVTPNWPRGAIFHFTVPARPDKAPAPAKPD